MDEWDLYAAEYDRLRSLAEESGMTFDEFMLHMQHMDLQMLELKQLEEKLKENGTINNGRS
jgi:hypothetical protein